MHYLFQECFLVFRPKFRRKYLYFIEDGRELVFDMQTDPHEQRNLSEDAELTGRLRARFIEHLAAECHSHVNEGCLVNEQQAMPDIQTVKAHNVAGWRATGWFWRPPRSGAATG